MKHLKRLGKGLLSVGGAILVTKGVLGLVQLITDFPLLSLIILAIVFLYLLGFAIDVLSNE